jgi:thymidylate synthase
VDLLVKRHSVKFKVPCLCFQTSTLDDAIGMILEELLRNGEPVTPSKGATLEIAGALVEISNPRARLSRTETRGRPFSLPR